MIQGSEFFIILLVALVVMGPQRLPEMARKAGHWTAELRKTAAELRAGLEAEVSDLQEISRELKAPLGDITAVAKDTADTANSALKPVNPGGPTSRSPSRPAAGSPPADGDLHGDPLAWTGPPPRSGPSPEDAMADLEEIERSGMPLSDELVDPPPAPPVAPDTAADDTAADDTAADDTAADGSGGDGSGGAAVDPPHEATG